MIFSKLPAVGVSIFTQMTALANEVGAINLSQGFPGFEPNSKLIERLAFYAANGKNQYSPATGVEALRQKIAEKYSYNANTEVTITSGASEALFVAIATVVTSGDEVIIIEPAYDLYVPAVLLQGGVPVFVKMKPDSFSIDWDEVESKISTKTKLIIINTPHNPTGKTLKSEDITELERLVEKYPYLYLVSDEVYEHIVFDGFSHLSLSQSKILRERTFICNSFAKTFHITGWKVGFCLAPEALSLEFRKIHQYVTFCTFTPAQFALADFLEDKSQYLLLSDFYEAKRNLFLKELEGSVFTPILSEGTFFQNLTYQAVSQSSDKEISKLLTQKAGVASIPTSAFYNDATDHKILRFCFAKDDATLTEAAQRLVKASEYLK